MRLYRILLALFTNGLGPAQASHARSNQATTSHPPKFIRLSQSKHSVALQTSIRRYQNAAGLTIDLVGSIHIADSSYFRQLANHLQTYPIVLFEMVGGEGLGRHHIPPPSQPLAQVDDQAMQQETVLDNSPVQTPSPSPETADSHTKHQAPCPLPPSPTTARAQASHHPPTPPSLISLPEPDDYAFAKHQKPNPAFAKIPLLDWVNHIYKKIAQALDLSLQTGSIDYLSPNFKHADLTNHQFKTAQKEKGESLWKFIFSDSPTDSAKISLRASLQSRAALILAATRKDPIHLKTKLLRSLAQSESLFSQIQDSNVIVNQRNQHCIEVLDQQIQLGHRFLAIFFGAAHLIEIEQILLQREFTLTDTKWIDAWTIPNKPD